MYFCIKHIEAQKLIIIFFLNNDFFISKVIAPLTVNLQWDYLSLFMEVRKMCGSACASCVSLQHV